LQKQRFKNKINYPLTMVKIMPQEMEVWYLLPAIRRELTKIFIKDHRLKQKEIAEILGITEAAISQYKNQKRGKDFSFNKEEKELIRKVAKRMINNKGQAHNHLYLLSKKLKGSDTLCKLHRKLDSSFDVDCKLCKTR
jgi:predicted transcriptional regulator